MISHFLVVEQSVFFKIAYVLIVQHSNYFLLRIIFFYLQG